MQRLLILGMAMVFSLLLFGVSPSKILAQEVRDDSMLAQNQTVAPQIKSKPGQQVKPQALSVAVSTAKLSPANTPPETSPNTLPKQNANKASNAGQEPKPLTKRLRIPDKGVTVHYPEDWSITPGRFTNAYELRNVPESKRNTPEALRSAQIFIFTEQRTSHEDALRRLAHIAGEVDAPTTYLKIGGWPALQYSYVAPMEQRGNRDRHETSAMGLRITTAIAAGDTLIRIDGRLQPGASKGVENQILAISRAVVFATVGKPSQVDKEIENLRKGSAVKSGQKQGVAGAPAATKPDQNFTEVPGAESSELPGLTTRVNNTNGRDSEIEMAVSTDGRNIVIGNNSRDYMFSNDGGRTFNTGVVPPSGGANGDPSLAFARSGAFYYAYIGFPTATQCSTAINRSTDNGQTFPFQAHAVLRDDTMGTMSFPDQEHIAADRFNQGPMGDQIYSVWRDFTGGNCANVSGPVVPSIVCSQDNGANWTGVAAIGAGDFPRVSVGQDGFVYAVWRSGANLMLNKYSSCANGLAVQPGFPVVVDPAVVNVDCPIPGLDRCNGRNTLSSHLAAVDDTNPNHVYVAYAVNTVPGVLGNENVLIRDSLDGGLTWPAGRVVVANSGVVAKRFMPWVCTAGGAAYVSWYDRRNATAANNDITDFFGGSASLDLIGNLKAGPEFKISEVSDAHCAAGWPSGVDNMNDSESCSIQPQLGGRCLDAMGNGSGNPCDFSDGGCPMGETCQVQRGSPKYGDYNGNACAAGRFFAAFASATSPPGITPASTDIDVFFFSKVVSAPQIQVPGPISFGDICVGSTGTQTLSVCNTGKTDLEINSITSSNSEFAVTTPSSGYPVVISPDFCFPFQVTFTPSSTGNKTTTLTINSNDSVNPAVQVQANGAGTRQAIDTLIPNSGDYGLVCVGSFKDQNLTINNSGGCDLVINSVTSIGADASQFVVAGDNIYPITVAPGTSVQIPIRFQPTSIGNKSATIRVNNNDPVSPNKDVPVSGHADPGDIRVTGSTEFGDVCGGTQAEKSVSICNVANACDLHVTSVALTNAAGDGPCADFTIVNNPFPATVSHDFCVPLTVRFTPTSAGPKQCRLVISSDDPDTPVVVKIVTANTPLASIDVSPDQSFLPEVVQSIGFCTTLQPFPISNKGNCPVKVTDVSIVDNDPNFGLSALPSFPINLQPGHTIGDGDLQTVFKPLAPVARERAAVLSVTYESDPITHTLTTETRDLCGEAVNTGARVLVRSAGVPLAFVESIRLNRINANRNRNNVDTVDNARNLELQTFTYPAGSACTAFQYHREYGTASNPIQLLPGSYTVTATAIVNGRRRSKTVAFDVQTCDFNPTVVVDF